MKVTKQQKIFLGLLGLGLAALTLDRFVLAPASAEAADDSASLLVSKEAHPAAPAPPALQKAPTVNSTAGDPITHKLKALSDAMHLAESPARDAFVPAPAWSGGPGAPGMATRNFEEAHQLSGVMLSGSHPAAMVDGRMVLTGQMVDGYKLVSVTKGAAVFQSGETQVTLRSR